MSRALCKFKLFRLIQCLMIFLIVISIFGILWIRSNVLTVEYKLSQLEDKKKALLREQKVLLAERASLTSLAKVERTDSIALQFPDRKKVIYITKKSEDTITNVSFNLRK